MTFNSVTSYIDLCEFKLRKGLPLDEAEKRTLQEIQTAFLTGGFCRSSRWPLKVRELIEG